MSTELDVRGFLETSFLDWDGKVVATVFLPYCNFCCPFCHNVELLKTPEDLKQIPIQQIEQYLVEHKDFIDGICITGGEPCLHKARGLFEFMDGIKKLGFKIKLDTNGYDPKCLKIAIERNLVDYVAMDIKGPIDGRYNRLSGIETDMQKIKESIKILKGSRVEHEFRTTVVPTLLSKNDVVDIAKYLKGAKKYVLQQFVPNNTVDQSLAKVKPFEKNELLEMVQAAQQFVPNTILRGI